MLTVKSYDTAAALNEFVQAAAAAPPPILSLQNGVGNEEALAAALGSANVLAGGDHDAGLRAGAGSHPGRQARLHASALAPVARRCPRLAGRCDPVCTDRAGFNVKRFAAAQSMKWTKLLMNMVGNAACAILDMTPAQEMAEDVLVDLEIDAWREALDVMQAGGHPPRQLGRLPLPACWRR